MNKTWILIAHRAGARIFENDGPGKGLKHVDAIAHPEGRLENKALGSDKPGRSFDSHGPGRHALGKEHGPAETVAQEFAHALAARLDAGRTRSMPTGNWCWWPSRAFSACCALRSHRKRRRW